MLIYKLINREIGWNNNETPIKVTFLLMITNAFLLAHAARCSFKKTRGQLRQALGPTQSTCLVMRYIVRTNAIIKCWDGWFRPCGVVVITTAQLHSIKPELRLCASLNHVHGVSEIWDGKDPWQWSWLEIRLNVFCRSTIPQNKQFNSIQMQN